MASYELEFTDIDVPLIVVDENTVNNTSLDITLFGFEKLNYGRELNENFVHIMERFALPESEGAVGTPDLSKVSYDGSNGTNFLLNTPVEGQFWYNKTASQLIPNLRFDDDWHPLEKFSHDVAANWGQIADGEQIPQPVSDTGYVFPYEECSWIVSPFNQVEELVDMVCRTDENANVIMQYLFEGDSTKTSAIANYMIVGLKDNNNLGQLLTPEPQPSATPTPTPSTSQGASPTPTPTNTPTPTPTPSNSPEATLSGLALAMFDPYTASCTGTCEASTTVARYSDFNVSGGSGNYAYSWSYFSGVSFQIEDANTASPTLKRTDDEGSENVTGYGILTVTDTVTTDTITKTFAFITNHELVDVTPSPTPTPTPTPTPSSSVTPTPTPTPTPTNTPTPSPSNSATPVQLEYENEILAESEICTAGAGSIGGNLALSVSSGVAPYTFTITNFVITSQNGPISSGPTASLGSIDSTNGTANLAVTYSYSDGNVASGAQGEVTVEVQDGNGTTDSTTFGWFLTKCEFGL